MAVTGTFTVSQIVTAAFRKARLVAVDEAVQASDLAHGIQALNWMLKAWQRFHGMSFAVTGGSLTLTTAASYTMSPVRPIRIINARYKGTNGIEIPMVELTRDEYDIISDKTTTGIPTQFYYDRQREAAKLYVWPVLSSATTESVEYTYERELEDISGGSDTIDIPVEWHEAAVYGLAARLCDDYGKDAQVVQMKAEMLLRDILAEDHSGSVFFLGEEYA